MIVSNNNLCFLQVSKHVSWNQFTTLIITIRGSWLQDSQAIADSYTSCDNLKTTGKFFAIRMTNGVYGLQGDNHGHYGGLAGTSGHF